MTQSETVHPTQTGFFGHPRGLATLFFTEMWERFSYYGMRALLILFMTDVVSKGGFEMGTARAGAIYGLYTFAVYALALPGGWIADRLLGQRVAVLWGGVIIALGHYVLAIPSATTFYMGLILVAIGTGLLKPNVSAIVGDLYEDKGARRDAGFSIFYMGINIGALLGPMICSFLGEEVNWHLGFAAAGIGMTFAIVQYVVGRKHLQGAGELPPESRSPEKMGQAKLFFGIGVAGTLGVIALLYFLGSTGTVPITIESFADYTSYVVTVLAVLYFACIIFFVCKGSLERQRVALIALLFLGAAFFWSGFEQAGTVMNLFAEEYTDRHIMGWEAPTGWLQSVNPLFIILLAPVVGMLWQKLGERSPNIGIKFGSGLILLGVGFFVMLWASQYIDDGQVGPQWLVACYFFHTVGELVLSPVGLSAVTKLSPDRLVSQMMGTWFMGAALGNLIAGIVAGGLEESHPSVIFRTVALVAIGAGILFLVLSPWMKKLAGGHSLMKELYAEHVAERQRLAEEALAATGFDALVLSSGTPFRYFADDMDAPHHPNPHFAHWVPLAGPYHLLLVRPGKQPKLIRFAPEDYWYEQAPIGEPFWLESFDYEEAGDRNEAWKRVAGEGRTAYVGDAPDEAREHGIDAAGIEPEELVAHLDWGRSYKSAYEAECVEEAARMAARGHVAARATFEGGGSELDIHHAYVAGVGCIDHQLPYPSIVALNEKGATLHYEKKRTERDGKVLLIDAGATCQGYASDITRTWTVDACDATFRELVAGMDELQRALCEAVRPGLPYPDLHHLGHVRIGDLLNAIGVLKVAGEDAVAAGLTRPFFPHGLGHFLGIQVHDVGGHQAAPSGGTNAPDEKHPYLRTTRTIEERMLFTVEPGIYFIPMLLREQRAGEHKDLVDWDLVDRLTPLGGVRIEDNVYVTADGHRNLTRPYI